MSRVAVITGASSGIGEATARALAADGHTIALLARRADRIQSLADELGHGAIAIRADITDRESVVAAADRVQQDLGGADILVNNAGVMLTAPFSSDQRGEHRRMVETNLLGAMTTTEVFLGQLRDHGGDLVNISSVAGRIAPAGFAAYAATKWGINGWSEALRLELQPDIRVTVNGASRRSQLSSESRATICARTSGKIRRMTEELLDRVLREIRERKQAAQGAVDEFARLERALAALDHDKPDRVVDAASSPGRGRRSSKPRKRAPRGANRDAILALVRERPGVTAGEIAAATGIARSTVAPSVARLAKAGGIERVELPGGGRGFRAVLTERGEPGRQTGKPGRRSA